MICYELTAFVFIVYFKSIYISLKEDHDKVMNNLHTNMNNPQPYITCKSLNNTEKSIIFGLRSQSIRGFKIYFPNMFSENSLCPICERTQDTQEHLPLFPVLQSILTYKEAYRIYSYIWVSGAAMQICEGVQALP